VGLQKQPLPHEVPPFAERKVIVSASTPSVTTAAMGASFFFRPSSC
jgi:hypothetical protein